MGKLLYYVEKELN